MGFGFPDRSFVCCDSDSDCSLLCCTVSPIVQVCNTVQSPAGCIMNCSALKTAWLHFCGYSSDSNQWSMMKLCTDEDQAYLRKLFSVHSETTKWHVSVFLEHKRWLISVLVCSEIMPHGKPTGTFYSPLWIGAVELYLWKGPSNKMPGSATSTKQDVK